MPANARRLSRFAAPRSKSEFKPISTFYAATHPGIRPTELRETQQQVFKDVDQPLDLQIIQGLGQHGDGAPAGQRFRGNPIISPASIQKIYM
jgi:hypothetical protein